MSNSPKHDLIPGPPPESIKRIIISHGGFFGNKDYEVDFGFDERHAICYIERGCGYFSIDHGPESAIRSGSILQLTPGHHYRFGPHSGTTWDEYSLGFHGPIVETWQECDWWGQTGKPTFIGVHTTILQIFRNAIQCLQQPRPGNADRVALYIEQLLLEVFHYKHQSLDQRPPLIENITTYCQAHLHQNVDFKALATSLHVSYSLLRQQIRHYTGLPPHRFHTGLRCEEAKLRLLNSNERIADIAAALGYIDPYDFSRTFKKYTGSSPMRFRQQMLAWRSRT